MKEEHALVFSVYHGIQHISSLDLKTLKAFQHFLIANYFHYLQLEGLTEIVATKVVNKFLYLRQMDDMAKTFDQNSETLCVCDMKLHL